MNRPTTLDRSARALIAEHLCVEPERVTDDANLTEDLSADSLDAIELAMKFEERFGIQLSDDEVDGAVTVGDLIKAVTEKLSPIS